MILYNFHLFLLYLDIRKMTYFLYCCHLMLLMYNLKAIIFDWSSIFTLFLFNVFNCLLHKLFLIRIVFLNRTFLYFFYSFRWTFLFVYNYRNILYFFSHLHWKFLIIFIRLWSQFLFMICINFFAEISL